MQCPKDKIAILMYVNLGLSIVTGLLIIDNCHIALFRDACCLDHQFGPAVVYSTATVNALLVTNLLTGFDMHKITKTVLFALGAAFNIVLAINWLGGLDSRVPYYGGSLAPIGDMKVPRALCVVKTEAPAGLKIKFGGVEEKLSWEGHHIRALVAAVCSVGVAGINIALAVFLHIKR